jgi:hypothetical protein
MKSSLVVLATILPLAISAATSKEPDISLNQKQELPANQALRCELNTLRALRPIPCLGASTSPRNSGEKINLVYQFTLGAE